MAGRGRYDLCIEMVRGSAIKYKGEDMPNLMTALTADERTSLYRIIGKEWDAVYRLWCYAQSRGQHELEDFHGYCSELTGILDDINAADRAAHALASGKYADALDDTHDKYAGIDNPDNIVLRIGGRKPGLYLNGEKIV